MQIRFLTVLLIVISLACNISMLQAKLIEKSSNKMPSWIGKTSEDKNKMYFSGSSTQDTFDKARKLAVSDALAQVAESLDLTMSVNTNRLITDTEVFLEDRTKSNTRDVRLLNTKIKEVYFEQYENEGRRSYNVYVLMEYPKKDYQKEKERLAKEYENFRQNIANRRIKANQLLQINQYQGALSEFIESLKIIYTYGVSRSLETEILSKINELLSYIEFKDSYSSSNSQSGVTAKFNIYFSKAAENYKKAAFSVKTLKNFSIDTVYTNDAGELDYLFKKVSFLKRANYKLDLDLKTTYNLEDDFIKSYSFKEISKELNFLGDKRKVALNISSDSNKQELEDLIKSNLIQNSFVVVNADFDFIVNINFKFVETIQREIKNSQSADTKLFISNANVTAELVSAKDKTQISSISFEERGFGKSKNQSYFDLLQKAANSIINTL